MIRSLLFLILITLSACTTSRRYRLPKDQAFAFGTYQHKVHVTPIAPRPVPTMDFLGAVRWSPQELKVVGLSPVGSTVFRIHEDFTTHKVEIEVYIENLKQHERQILRLYELIRAALLAERSKLNFDFYGAQIKISQTDPKGVPRRIEITHPRVHLQIEITEYALD